MKTPLISIIITTYNRAELIHRSLNSVLAQTYENWEVLIIDDGSTDNTADVVKNFLSDKRFRYFFKKNGGFPSAANLGIEQSVGEYLCFLDSDDAWFPEKLFKQLRFLESNVDFYMVSCWTLEISSEKNRLIVSNNFIFNDHLDGYLSSSCFLVPSTLMIRNNLKDRIYFSKDFAISFDVDYLVSHLKKYKIYILQEPLLKYYVHGSNNSIELSEFKRVSLARDILIILEKHSDFFSYHLKHKARMLRNVGTNYILGGMWFCGLKNYFRSLFICPFNLKTVIAIFSAFFGRRMSFLLISFKKRYFH